MYITDDEYTSLTETLVEAHNLITEYWNNLNSKLYPYNSLPDIKIALTDDQIFIIMEDKEVILKLIDIYGNIFVVSNPTLVEVEDIKVYYVKQDKLRVISCSKKSPKEMKFYNHLNKTRIYINLKTFADMFVF